MNIQKIIKIADDVRSFNKKASSSLSDTVRDLGILLNNTVNWALCGGLAVGVHARPRGTNDVDILLKNDSEISKVID